MKRSWRTLGIAAGTVIGAVFLFGIVWALIEPYTFATERHLVDVPDLQEDWYGKRVAVIADFQVGMWLDKTSTTRWNENGRSGR